MRKGLILSVDDDTNLQTVLSEYLESDGYELLTATNVKTALNQTKEKKPDLVLLDLGLPDGEGLNLIPKFKSMNGVGIIVVSGKDDTTEKIICLEMGADDYLTKPFEMRELSARIKAVRRRMDEQESPDNAPRPKKKDTKTAFSNGWYMDRDQFQVFDEDGQSADLTAGEFKLLDALVSAPNRALSREQLFEITRSDDYSSFDRAIDVQIARLRKKLKDNEEKSNIIKTVHGVGYMFAKKS